MFGEDSLEESVAAPLPRGPEAGQLDQVESETDDCFRIGIH